LQGFCSKTWKKDTPRQSLEDNIEMHLTKIGSEVGTCLSGSGERQAVLKMGAEPVGCIK
jgi:hypothetical protein